MNEIMALLTAYGISLNEALAIGGGGLLVLLIGAKLAFKKKPNIDKTSQEVTPFSIAPNTYNSLQTDEVNSFLIPREDIEDVKSLKVSENVSPHSNLATESIFKRLVNTDEDRQIQEKISKLPRVSNPVFLDEIIQLKNPEKSTDTIHNHVETIENPQASQPVEKTVEKTIIKENSRDNFSTDVKTLIDESVYPQTILYHQLIEDALYFDSIDDKVSALEKLDEACSCIDNVRTNFYMKICIQSYKNQDSSLSSLMEQFFLTEKEKLERSENKKASIDALSQPADGLAADLENIVEKPPMMYPHIPSVSSVVPWKSAPILYQDQNGDIKESPPMEVMMPLARPVTAWKEGSVLSVSENGQLEAYKPDVIMHSNTDNPELQQNILDLTPDKKEIEESEFSDDATKEQFMQAFGSMFTLKNSVPTQENKEVTELRYSVWVNWVAVEEGRVNFKNDPFELKGPWGTKVAIEDLQEQIKERIGVNNQFSVLSVFEVK